jgi:TonB-linked SusC/RagA family outer membrane protein
MKLTTVLFVSASLQLTARSYAQNLSLSEKNTALEKVFKHIKEQTGYYFLYKNEMLNEAHPVTLTMQNASLKDVLEAVFRSQPLYYKIVDKTIVIQKKEDPQPSHIEVQPASIIIKGTIYDTDGHPLAGATISIRGGGRGTQTNDKGEFSLEIPDEQVILVISYVGYEPKEIRTEGKKELSITLTSTAGKDKLNDVVVIGYGTVPKKDLTTSISTVSARDIMKTPVTTLDQALQGNAAGVQVVSTTGQPGDSVFIRIRGSSSIKADNQPLLVVDGFTTDAGLSSINPADIKSIEVLKDAGATAIYGSRGANGVILVTTKGGLPGAPRVNVESYYGLQRLRRKLPLLNAPQLARLQNDANATAGKPLVTTQPDTIPTNIDWQNAMFHTSPMLSNTVTLSGGESKVRYYIAANYLDQQGIIINSSFSRASLRSNLDFSLNSHIRAGINLNLAQTLRSGIQQGDNGSILRADATSPNTNQNLDPTGSFFIDPNTGEPSVSPLANAQMTLQKTKNSSIYAGAYIHWDIVKGLSFRTTGVYNPANILNTYYFPNSIAGNKVSDAYEESVLPSKWTNTNILSFNKTIARHSFTILTGEEMTGSFSNTFHAESTNFSTDLFSYYSLQSGNGVPVTSSGAVSYSLMSLFGRATYNFDDRYLLSFSYRADGSSKFGADHKWGYFPAVSAAWRASNEPFVKRLSWLDDLKFRASYGVNGSDRISPYSSLALYSSVYSAIGGAQQTGYMINKLANPDLKWETTDEYDVGTDVLIFKGRISFTADYYLKHTHDLLLDYGLAAASGYTTVPKNIGSVQNQGWEFDLGSRNIIGKFTWTTSFNAGFNHNKVTNLGGPAYISAISNSSANTKFGNVVVIQVGQPLGAFWGYKMNGLFQTQAEIDATPARLEGNNTKPGFPKYVDLNKDGVLNDADKVILGSPQPKWFGGMTNNFSYKNFDLSIFITWQQGNSILNTSYTKLLDLTGNNNQLTTALHRWRAPDPTTGDPGNYSNTIPRAYATGYTAAMSNFYIEDGSFLRLKTLTIAYNLPGPMLQKIHVSGIRIYASAINLLTLTKYDGYDPEVSIMGDNSVGAGMDNGAYPTSKMYMLGLNVKF